MAEEATLEKLRERRIERMRLGQNALEIVDLPSDSEIRIGLVPLTEAEYDTCMRITANLDVPENVAGAGVMDRHEKREVVYRACRNVSKPSELFFNNIEEMMELLQPEDFNHMYDRYVEMCQQFSPHVAELTGEEIDYLKEFFVNFQWKGLSGRQLYALNRFILALSPEQLSDNLPGFISTI